jgi:PAS domain S-box-containing protein
VTYSPCPAGDAGHALAAKSVRATIEALGQSQAQRLAAIVESSDDAILSVDLEGTIATWNRGAEKLFGYLSEEVIGGSVLMLIPADRQSEEPDILERIRRGEHVKHYETVRRSKDGRPVPVSLSVSPIIDASGVVPYIAYSGYDQVRDGCHGGLVVPKPVISPGALIDALHGAGKDASRTSAQPTALFEEARRLGLEVS